MTTQCKFACPHGDRCTLGQDHEGGHNHLGCDCNEPDAELSQDTLEVLDVLEELRQDVLRYGRASGFVGAIALGDNDIKPFYVGPSVLILGMLEAPRADIVRAWQGDKDSRRDGAS